jgi:hypothetical protein
MPKRSTTQNDAWRGDYLTVQLYEQLQALRVHVNAGVGAVTDSNIHLSFGASLQGRWFAIGDFSQTYDDYISSRALPQTPTRYGRRSFFTHAAIATFGPGVILNVGIAAPLGPHKGGGEQAEFLEGPAPKFKTITTLGSLGWSNKYGHA